MEDPLFASSALTINRRIVTFDGEGNPVVAVVPLVTKAVMQDLYNAAAALPYEAPDPLDPDHQFHGMSCAEVIVRKQIRAAARTGDPGEVTDRLMGKPKQTSESLRVTVTYEERIKTIARELAGRQVPAGALDAEIAE